MKKSKQGIASLHIYIYIFIIIHRSSLRKAEKKQVSFYMIQNVLYKTKVIGVTKRLKSNVKT